MLMRTSNEIISHANVESAVLTTREDVDVELTPHREFRGYGFRLSLRSAGMTTPKSRRLEVGLERVDRDLEARLGVRAPQLGAVEHHGIEPLRIVALVDRDRVGERLAAVDELHHADLAAGVARQPGMRRRVDVLGAHPVTGLEASARARLAIERAPCHPLPHDVGRELRSEEH